MEDVRVEDEAEMNEDEEDIQECGCDCACEDERAVCEIRGEETEQEIEGEAAAES